MIRLTDHEIELVLHALSVTGTIVDDKRGREAAAEYDELHDKFAAITPTHERTQ